LRGKVRPGETGEGGRKAGTFESHLGGPLLTKGRAI
jgi:hypothetical protein